MILSIEVHKVLSLLLHFFLESLYFMGVIFVLEKQFAVLENVGSDGIHQRSNKTAKSFNLFICFIEKNCSFDIEILDCLPEEIGFLSLGYP